MAKPHDKCRCLCEVPYVSEERFLVDVIAIVCPNIF